MGEGGKDALDDVPTASAIVSRCDVSVRDIAATAAGDEDLLSYLPGPVQGDDGLIWHLPRGEDGRRQPRSPCAYDGHVNRLSHGIAPHTPMLLHSGVVGMSHARSAVDAKAIPIGNSVFLDHVSRAGQS